MAAIRAPTRASAAVDEKADAEEAARVVELAEERARAQKQWDMEQDEAGEAEVWYQPSLLFSDTCIACRQKGSTLGRKLQACAKCRCAHYCSAACQRADWPTHKRRCQHLARAKQSECETKDRVARFIEDGMYALAAFHRWYIRKHAGTYRTDPPVFSFRGERLVAICPLSHGDGARLCGRLEPLARSLKMLCLFNMDDYWPPRQMVVEFHDEERALWDFCVASLESNGALSGNHLDVFLAIQDYTRDVLTPALRSAHVMHEQKENERRIDSAVPAVVAKA